MSSSRMPGTMTTAWGRLPFSNIANFTASARSTNRPPQRPCWSWTTQLPQLSLPIRNSRGVEVERLEGGSNWPMVFLLQDGLQRTIEWFNFEDRSLSPPICAHQCEHRCV